MNSEAVVTDTTVRALAEVARLPLCADRALLLAPQLQIWVTLANELSRTMSTPNHSALMPISPFTHRPGGGNQ